MSRKIHCAYCDTFLQDVNHYVSHLERKHKENIPEGMDGWQFAYYLRTNKTHGTCIICKKDTTWNPVTHKYHRFCNNPKCKEKYREEFKSRMIGKYGKISLLDDPEQQRKMLSNRSISGTYTWRDKVHTSTYTGTYELSFLEFLDHVLDFDPEDVMSPSPHTYWYEYEGEKHFYIPDFFIPSLNLEIEIKEGTNQHPKNLAVDKVKERLKDDVMKSNASTFNYLKIIEKDNKKFLKYLMVAKEKFINNDNSHIVML